MAGFRLCAALLLVLAALTQFAHAGSPKGKTPTEKMTCTVYSLASAGDTAYSKWVADTIPKVIDPESWSDGAKGGKPVITYNSARRVLVVLHTPTVQAKVAAFIKQMEKAGATGGEEASEPRPDGAREKALKTSRARPAQANAPGAGYVVPAPVKQPKHLVHFIFRYEGDGFIDSNVVKFARALADQNAKSSGGEDKTTETVGPSSFIRPPVGSSVTLPVVPGQPLAAWPGTNIHSPPTHSPPHPSKEAK
jgi:hypothetical protein